MMRRSRGYDWPFIIVTAAGILWFVAVLVAVFLSGGDA